jgi:NADPH:quinone reductase-like Zn-dependent oxidoreductase
VVLVDLAKSILFNLTEHEFNMIKRVTNEAKTLIWASAGGLLNGKDPVAGMVAGLMRSVRAEQATISIVTIDFDLSDTPVLDAVNILLHKSVQQITDSENVESEYCVADSNVYISRLLPNRTLNKEQTIQEIPYDPEMRIEGVVETGKVVFEQVAPSSTVPADAVEIRVEVSALSKEGVLAVQGTDISTALSHEVGGTVEQIGSSVTDVAVGDRVVGLAAGRFGNHQVLSATLVQKLLPEESLQNMVSLPLAYVTALYGLQDLAATQPGERVLVLGSTGYGGAAAVAVALAMGAVPYVVVASDNDKRATSAVAQRFGLPLNQVLASASQLEALLTGPGAGVDVVFGAGTTPEAEAREAWRHIGRFGRFVDCGRKLVLKRGSRDPVPFYRGASYHAFDAVDLVAHKPAVAGRLLAETVCLYRRGSIASLGPLNVVETSELDRAIARFTDELGSGRTVIAYGRSETPLHVLPAAQTTALKADATYLLVGCLGGLGRSLTAWMMERGARTFCFLSRRGADAPRAARLVKDLELAGASVNVVRGDVSVREDVERAVATIPSDRPLRGVIQAAMVLRVSNIPSSPLIIYIYWYVKLTTYSFRMVCSKIWPSTTGRRARGPRSTERLTSRLCWATRRSTSFS